MAIKRPFIISVITIGITSIVAQIVLLRELITVFYGNEISLGLILAFWLFMGAVGSLLLGRFADRISRRIILLALCQLFLSIILPFLIILIRNIKDFFGFLPGEIMPLGILTLSVPVILAPLCITLGFLFALSCKMFPTEDPALKIGHVYILESLGAVLGGLTVSFFLIRHFTSFEILFGLGIINLLACIMLLRTAPATKTRKIITLLSYAWSAIIALSIISGGPAYLDRVSREASWRPFEIVASEDSIYGNVSVIRSGATYSFFTNGLHNFTIPDRLSQEEAVHFSLSQHRRPQDILLIGGGAGGIIWEVLKYPVEKIDYVELDPLIIKFASAFLQNVKYSVLDNPKVNIINGDGRLFIKNRSSRYDVIIISLPDPYTAQLNRFYTKEFYEEAERIMNPGAILSFGVTSSENYISTELAMFLSSLYNTLKSVFPDVVFIPGDTALFMASRENGHLTVDYNRIAQGLRRQNIETGFVNEDYLFSRLSKERIEYMSDVLKEKRVINANFDFRPISYYYDMILWSSYFKSWLRKTASILNAKIIWALFILFYILIIFGGWILRRSSEGILKSTLTAIGVTGFSEIVFEIIVILSFQIIYGFLYYKLGLMLTSFMVGLLLGSIYIAKKLDKIEDPVGAFIKIQICVTLYPLILPVVFSLVAQNRSLHLSWLGSNIIFPALPVIAGFIGGLQFPLGNKIYLSGRRGVGQTGGTTYGIDLIGACLGALLVSAFIIPIIGIFQTCIAVGLLNFSVLLCLILNKR